MRKNEKMKMNFIEEEDHYLDIHRTREATITDQIVENVLEDTRKEKIIMNIKKTVIKRQINIDDLMIMNIMNMNLEDTEEAVREYLEKISNQ